jgi:hypothetical protein
MVNLIARFRFSALKDGLTTLKSKDICDANYMQCDNYEICDALL